MCVVTRVCTPHRGVVMVSPPMILRKAPRAQSKARAKGRAGRMGNIMARPTIRALYRPRSRRTPARSDGVWVFYSPSSSWSCSPRRIASTSSSAASDKACQKSFHSWFSAGSESTSRSCASRALSRASSYGIFDPANRSPRRSISSASPRRIGDSSPAFASTSLCLYIHPPHSRGRDTRLGYPGPADARLRLGTHQLELCRLKVLQDLLHTLEAGGEVRLKLLQGLDQGGGGGVPTSSLEVAPDERGAYIHLLQFNRKRLRGRVKGADRRCPTGPGQ